MNLHDFIFMNGYGFYVWGSYLIALIAMCGEVILLRRRGKGIDKTEYGKRK